MMCKYSERFLQILWNERMAAMDARTVSGERVRILSGGMWNRSAGPDFTGAAVIVGDVLRRGDIEVHRLASDWFAHGHDADERYAGVVLHVVWCNDIAPSALRQTGLPTLELSCWLQPGWHSLLRHLEECCYPRAREMPPGACAVRWALAGDAVIGALLEASGEARILRRGSLILSECAGNGVEETLYARLFEALGYAGNRRQFRCLAENVPLSALRECRSGIEAQALLFGAVGLLPDNTRREVGEVWRSWSRCAWRCWWQSGRHAPAIAWNHSGLRPFNSIFRRLAGGYFWLKRHAFAPVEWVEGLPAECGGEARRLLRLLLEEAPEEAPWPEWMDFYHPLPRRAALLGTGRLADLAMNLWLPYLAAKAKCGGDERTAAMVGEALRLLPALSANHLLDEACHRFLAPPSRGRALLKKAIRQQGLMDIYQMLCLALSHDCRECPCAAENLRQQGS